MAWTDAISDIVSRYTAGAGGTASAPADPHEDYRTIAQSASPRQITDALSDAFAPARHPAFRIWFPVCSGSRIPSREPGC